MSKITETFVKDLVESIVMNTVNFSASEMKKDIKNRVVDNVDDNDDKKVESFEVAPIQQCQQITQDTNMNISEILQQIAQFAESLRGDLQNIQVGDYVVSVNASPLEIQVKQAISSLRISEDNLTNKIIITKGEGDGEHQDLTTDNETNEQILIDKSNIKNSSSRLTLSPPSSNATVIINAIDPQLEIEQQLTGSLKRKKCITLGERIRRIFRFTFNRRRNS